ncbi:MAG: L-threonylcarbamoyladenylate synthase [Termitinemataceae bacterium]
MISYIAPGNIDDRILRQAAEIVNNGGLLAIPTDTSWTIVCALTSKTGIKKLRHISGERDERHFTLLCNSISQIGDFCSMNNSQFRLIKRLTPGPYVFIMKTLLGTEKALDIRRKEVGVRISNHPVPGALILATGNPLYSITAKRTMIESFDTDLYTIENNEAGEDANLPPIPEEALFEGGWELEGIPNLDLILDTGEELPRFYSTVLDLTGDDVLLVRSGAGPWPC